MLHHSNIKITQTKTFPRVLLLFLFPTSLGVGKQPTSSPHSPPPWPPSLLLTSSTFRSLALAQMLNTRNLHGYDGTPPGPSQVPGPLTTATLHVSSEQRLSLNTFCITFHPDQGHTMTSCFLCIDIFNFLALYNLRSLSLVPNICYVLLSAGQCPALVSAHVHFQSLLIMVFSPFLLIFFPKQSTTLQAPVTSPSRRLSDTPLPSPSPSELLSHKGCVTPHSVLL